MAHRLPRHRRRPPPTAADRRRPPPTAANMRQVPMAEKRIARYTADPNAPKKDI